MNDDRLGMLLCTMGLLSKEDLQLAILERKSTGGKLGECIVSLGFVTQEAMDKALETQEKFREGDTGDALMDVLDAQLDVLTEKNDGE